MQIGLQECWEIDDENKKNMAGDLFKNKKWGEIGEKEVFRGSGKGVELNGFAKNCRRDQVKSQVEWRKNATFR